MRVPLPKEGLSASGTPQVGLGGRVAPMPNGAPQQIQQAGQAAQQAGAQIVQLAAMIQEQEDTADAQRAYAQFGSAVSAILEDPEQGYLHQRGENALKGARAKALGLIEEARSQAEKGLTSPGARASFGAAARQRLQQVQGQVFNHEAGQRYAYLVGQTKAMADQARRDALSAFRFGEPVPELTAAGDLAAREQAAVAEQRPGQPEARGGLSVPVDQEPQGKRTPGWRVNMNTYLDRIRELGGLEGLPKEEIQRQVVAARSGIYGEMLESLLADERVDEAAEFVEGLPKTKVDPGVLAQMQAKVAAAGSRAKAMRVADEVHDGLMAVPEEPLDDGPPVIQIAGEGRTPTSLGEVRRSLFEQDAVSATRPGGPTRSGPGGAPLPGYELAAFEELRGRFERGEISAEERQAAMSQIRERRRLELTAWSEQATAAWRELDALAAANPQITDLGSPSIPKGLRDRLVRYGTAGEAQQRLSKAVDERAGAEAFALGLATAKEGGFRGMPEWQFLATYEPRLPGRRFGLLHSMWKEANGDQGTAPFKFGWSTLRYLGEIGWVTKRTSDGGFLPDVKDTSEMARFDVLLNRMEQWTESFRAANGREPTEEEATERVKSFASDVVITDIDMIWDDEANVIEAEVEGVDPEEWTLRVGDRYVRAAEVRGDFTSLTRDSMRLEAFAERALASMPADQAQERINALDRRLASLGFRSYVRDPATGRLMSSAQRPEIERLWAELGLSLVEPSQQQLAEEYLQAKQAPGTVEYLFALQGERQAEEAEAPEEEPRPRPQRGAGGRRWGG